MEFLKHNVDYVIIGILGLMSFVVVWLTIERLIFYANVKFENYKNQDDFEESMTRNLTTLYIIYSNAPYVGLLGTVAGIMVTFYQGPHPRSRPECTQHPGRHGPRPGASANRAPQGPPVCRAKLKTSSQSCPASLIELKRRSKFEGAEMPFCASSTKTSCYG